MFTTASAISASSGSREIDMINAVHVKAGLMMLTVSTILLVAVAGCLSNPKGDKQMITEMGGDERLEQSIRNLRIRLQVLEEGHHEHRAIMRKSFSPEEIAWVAEQVNKVYPPRMHRRDNRHELAILNRKLRAFQAEANAHRHVLSSDRFMNRARTPSGKPNH